MKTNIKPLVSIIIPTYNGARFIKEAVDSILEQNYRPLEIIVVDDGSQDNTKEVVKKFGKRVQYIYKNNQRLGKARNTGITQAKGEYLIFLDHDDLLFPGMIKKAIRTLKTHQNYKVVYGIAYSFTDDNGAVSEWTHTPRESGNVFEFIVKGFFLAQGQYMIHRSCIEEIGAFVDSTGEDWQFELRLAKSYPFLFLPYPFMKKRVHPAMATLNKKGRKALIEHRLEILEMTFPDEAEQIKKKYLNNKIISDWHYSCNDLKGSIKAYPWQPRIYWELVKQVLPLELLKRYRQLKVLVKSCNLW